MFSFSGRKKQNETKKIKKLIMKRVKKKDICCEEDIERDKCINILIDNYKIIAKNNLSDESEYLDFIHNDLTILVGYLSDLEKKKDKEGIKLWNHINKESQDNNKISLKKITKILYDVPLFFLMSLLGYSQYKIKL